MAFTKCLPAFDFLLCSQILLLLDVGIYFGILSKFDTDKKAIKESKVTVLRSLKQRIVFKIANPRPLFFFSFRVF